MSTPNLTALPGAPVPFQDALTTFQLPTVYTTSGQVGSSPADNTGIVSPNTHLDMPRFEADLVRADPGRPAAAARRAGMAPNIRTGYIGSFTASVEQTWKDVVFGASYVGTAGVKLDSIDQPQQL